MLVQDPIGHSGSFVLVVCRNCLQAEVRPAEEERLLEEEGLREEEEAQEAEARAQEAQRAEEVQTGTWPCCSVSCSLQTSKTLTALTFFNSHSTSS